MKQKFELFIYNILKRQKIRPKENLPIAPNSANQPNDSIRNNTLASSHGGSFSNLFFSNSNNSSNSNYDSASRLGSSHHIAMKQQLDLQSVEISLASSASTSTSMTHSLSQPGDDDNASVASFLASAANNDNQNHNHVMNELEGGFEGDLDGDSTSADTLMLWADSNDFSEDREVVDFAGRGRGQNNNGSNQQPHQIIPHSPRGVGVTANTTQASVVVSDSSSTSLIPTAASNGINAINGGLDVIVVGQKMPVPTRRQSRAKSIGSLCESADATDEHDSEANFEQMSAEIMRGANGGSNSAHTSSSNIAALFESQAAAQNGTVSNYNSSSSEESDENVAEKANAGERLGLAKPLRSRKKDYSQRRSQSKEESSSLEPPQGGSESGKAERENDRFDGGDSTNDSFSTSTPSLGGGDRINSKSRGQRLNSNASSSNQPHQKQHHQQQRQQNSSHSKDSSASDYAEVSEVHHDVIHGDGYIFNNKEVRRCLIGLFVFVNM
jgi:hypothetical protein